MSKTAALFSGQGSQYSGMGKELYENFTYVREIYECAGDILGYDLSEISFEPDCAKLSETVYAQPAIFALSVAAFETAAREIGFSPACAAGHSLGEYAALYCAKAFGIEDGFRIIKARARAMDAAANEDSAMYAILGGDVNAVKKACEEATGFAVPVNFNQPSQTVISGDKKACEEAAAALAAGGAKTVKLNVSGAFHTKFMSEAAEQFKSEISGIGFSELNLPFYSNLTGDMLKINDYPEYFAKHMVSPVLFSQEILSLSRDGVDSCVEFGPKRTAASLTKKNVKTMSVYGVEDLASLGKLRETLGAQQ